MGFLVTGFLVILGGTILISGVITGTYRAFQKIYGVSYPALFGDPEKIFHGGILPALILKTGVFSILGLGLSSIFIFSTLRKVETKMLFFGTGIGIILALIHILLVRKFQFRRLSCGIISGFVGGTIGFIGGVVGVDLFGRGAVVEFLLSGLIGLILGGIVGWFIGIKMGEFLTAKISGKISNEIVNGVIFGGIFSGILSFVMVFILKKTIYFILGIIGITPVIGVGVGTFFGGLIITAHIAAFIPHQIVFFAVSRLLILLRFDTIICNHCLRCTKRFRTHYKHGRRYCEHCQKEVEFTTDPGKVILTFGTFPLKSADRVFVLSNPDFEQKTHHIEVSEVYIDTTTADRRLFERFITYILYYPPEHGTQSLKIFYKGTLDDLGENLENVLRNNFVYLKLVSPDMSSTQKTGAFQRKPRPFSFKLLILAAIIGIILTPIISFFAGIPLLLPNPKIQWESTFSFASREAGEDDDVQAIQMMLDGGYIITGTTFTYSAKAWAIKIDTQGQLLWEHIFENNTYRAAAYTIQPTPDEGYIVVGHKWKRGANDDNAWIARFDEQGRQIWERSFGGEDYDSTTAIRPTLDGGCIVAGKIREKRVKQGDTWIHQDSAWVARFDAQGQQIWERTFDNRELQAIQLTPDGGYVTAGHMGTKEKGEQKVWVLKFDTQGQKLWEYTFGSSDNNRFNAIQVTSDGGYVIIGESCSECKANWNTWVFKLNAQGQQIWERSFGGEDVHSGDILAIQLTSDGSYIVAGSSRARDRDAWVARFDAQGEQIWEYTFKGGSQLNAIQLTPDGGYVLAGSARYTKLRKWFLPEGRSGNIWVFKFKPDDMQSK